jgi:FlgD Ig-like domain
MRTRVTLVVAAFLIPFGANRAHAGWVTNGVAVCAAAGDQMNYTLIDNPTIVSDEVGGAIVTWYDERNGSNNPDIFVQRVSASGTPLWTANGVAVCTAASYQIDPKLVSDGTGGAIITWRDQRTGLDDIYVQRVDASGTPLWTPNGIGLCTAPFSQYDPAIVSDGAGGAIVVWEDTRSGMGRDLYVQRVDASGIVQWVANGVVLCAAASEQQRPTITADGNGGAIVAWEDQRLGAGNTNLYVQLVDTFGTMQWAANGVALCTAANTQIIPRLVSDDAGGAIVTWQDERDGSGTARVFAQRVDVSGAPQWMTDGVALSNLSGYQSNPTIAADGAGGAIITFQFIGTSGSTDILAQRVGASGILNWPAGGTPLCTATNQQLGPTIIADGSGGAVVAWYDLRNGTDFDVFAQRVDAAGTPLWITDGVGVCGAVGDQRYATMVAGDMGAVILTWQDERNGTSDIYALRIEGQHGSWGQPEPVLVSVADIPGDQGGKVKVDWMASGWDVPSLQTISHYSVWRATDAVVAATVASRCATVRHPSDIPRCFAGHAIWVQHLASGDYYWEWVGNQDAHYRSAYSFSASTRSDSTTLGPAEHFFFVSAHTADPYVFFDSNIMSGHSVDNLAPAAPLLLTAQRVGADVVLRWHGVSVPDLLHYAVYRATSPGVTAVPIHFVSNAVDTVLVDTTPPSSSAYYVVTALDIHENQSVPSNEASVSPSTGVSETVPINGLTVLPNRPNPFTGTTELAVGLPAASGIEIEVYDAAGRRARAQIVSRRQAGWQRITFDGRDDAGRLLPSGIYFMRFRVRGDTVTRKLVIAR